MESGCTLPKMNTSDKNKLNTGTNLTEKTMSKAEETELRRYFIKALMWATGVAVTIIMSAGGVLYKQMYDQVKDQALEFKNYRSEHQEENKRVMVDYSSRLAILENEVNTIKQWQKEMQDMAKLSNNNQREILEAIKQIKGDLK